MNTAMLFEDCLDPSRLLNPRREVLVVNKVRDLRTGKTRPETKTLMECRVLFREGAKLIPAGKVCLPPDMFTWEGSNTPPIMERIGFARVK